jgi:hypothetical protein
VKGLVLYHPWAWFTMPAEPGAPARKRLETRGQPIGGLPGAPKRPTLPGCNATVGERVAIIAGQDRKPLRETRTGGGHPPVTAEQEATMWAELEADGITCEEDLPWGAVVGTVRLGNAFLMTDFEGVKDQGQPHLLVGTRYDPGRLLACLPSEGFSSSGSGVVSHFEWATTIETDQEPYGVWAPGRWAVELDDPVRLRTPVPILGRQGLHHLRDTRDGTSCPRCEARMLTTEHHEEHDWCPTCGWVDE